MRYRSLWSFSIEKEAFWGVIIEDVDEKLIPSSPLNHPDDQFWRTTFLSFHRLVLGFLSIWGNPIYAMTKDPLNVLHHCNTSKRNVFPQIYLKDNGSEAIKFCRNHLVMACEIRNRSIGTAPARLLTCVQKLSNVVQANSMRFSCSLMQHATEG